MRSLADARGPLLTLVTLLAGTLPFPTVAEGLIDQETEGSPPQKHPADSSESSHDADARVKKPTSSPGSDQLQEVLVTGSRIPLPTADGAQDVKIYTRDQIDQSGGTTLVEFLNTLPDASLHITENGFQTLSGTTTVQLHGLPIGTTLILVNGRRVGTSGAAQAYGLTYFDLNTIPLAAIDRIELVSQGSSAVYGSDAIAGVINIILKHRFSGFEANARYGWASGTDQTDVDVTWGRQWEKGSFTAVGSYLTRSELSADERGLTSDQNHVPYGGRDANFYMCPDQANIYSQNGANLPGLNAPYAAVPAGFTGVPSRSEFIPTAGTLNRCPLFKYVSLIPGSERAGILLEGTYDLTAQAEFYSNVLFSHIEQFSHNAPPILFGEPAFQQYTVSAANPFNPFGETVGVSDMVAALGRQVQDLRTNYLNAVAGFRGSFNHGWNWDLSISDSQDQTKYTQSNWDKAQAQAALNSSNPATALNPFIAAPLASSAVLQSLVTGDELDFEGRAVVANATVRGQLFELPGGPLRVVFGGEYERDTLYQNQFYFPGPAQITNFQRKSYALFTEVRAPLLGPASTGAPDRLAVTLAGRLDHYDEFGSKTTPQFGVEFRPWEPLLLRATYSKAFRAPDLIDLYAAQTISTNAVVMDPLRGNSIETVTLTQGGNPSLEPEEGLTRTFGFVYSGDLFTGKFRLAVTHWEIDETNGIQQFSPQVIVDNEAAFPGAVTRATSCQGAPPCPITAVSATYVNFGRLDVAGLDYQLAYEFPTSVGTFTPSVVASQTYRYEATLTPGSPAVNSVSVAQDTGNWATRLKGTVALDWHLGGWTVHLDGRYVGKYQDYDSTSEIGNFWIADADVRYVIGQAVAPTSRYWQNLYLRLGGVNLFNRLPQFSNFESGFAGYDPTQGDIRGRFLYAQVGVRW